MIVVLALLVALVAWAGAEHLGPSGTRPLPWYRGWVTEFFNGFAWVLSVGGHGAPLGFQLACLALAITLVVLGRRYLLVRNACRPGPVDVKDLVAATPGDTAAPHRRGRRALGP